MIASATTMTRPDTMPALLSQDEVADILGVSPRTLEDWRVSERGTAYVRVSYNKVRYEIAAIERFVAGARRG
jgi:uncharacterized protein YjcR